jgi:hypothetical protein
MVRTSRYLAVACLIAAGLAGCSRSSSPAPEPIGGPTMRLSAASVQGSAGIDLSAATDRDTTTGTTVSGPLDVVLRFDHAVEIRAVKARGDGVSIAVPGQGELQLTGGWGAIRFPAPVVAKELTVRVTSAGAASILQELEVWGAGRKRSPRSVAAMAEATRTDATAFEDVRVLAATPAAATLDPAESGGQTRCLKATFPRVDVTGARRAYLAYEADVPRAFALERILDGDAVTGGFWVGNVATSRTLVDELDPERLGTATGVQLCAPAVATGKVQVSGLRLLVVSDDGLDVFDRETHLKVASAVDGEATPSAVSGTVELTLDRPIALDEGSVRLGAAPVTLAALELLAANGWARAPDVELATESSALPVAGREARALRLVFPSPARADVPTASLVEVSVAGSGVGPRVGAARIVLTAPHLTFEGGREVGERFGDRAWIAGWAESPAGTGRVEIGGAEVGVAGVFGVALDRPATASPPWTVDVKATFPDGTTVVRTVVLDLDGEAELSKDDAGSAPSLSDAARFGQENQTGWGTIDPDGGGKVTLGTAPPLLLGRGERAQRRDRRRRLERHPLHLRRRRPARREARARGRVDHDWAVLRAEGAQGGDEARLRRRDPRRVEAAAVARVGAELERGDHRLRARRGRDGSHQRVRSEQLCAAEVPDRPRREPRHRQASGHDEDQAGDLLLPLGSPRLHVVGDRPERPRARARGVLPVR